MKNIKILLPLALFALVIFLTPAGQAIANVTVSPATGGSAISADTTGGSYTALTGPAITEGATADIGTGTIILVAPAGFVFSTTANSVTATRTDVSGTGCNASRRLLINGAGSQTVTPTSSTITISITRSTSSSCRNAITWSGISVRPSAGTPLASGNITKSGTSSILGITAGSTNLGTLTEVAGATANYSLNDVVNVVAGERASYTVTRKDQYNNLVTSGASSTIYLYSSSVSATKKFYDAGTLGNIITSLTISNGSSTANFWYYDETPGNYTITASDNASAPDGITGIDDGTDAISVLASPLASFSLTGDATLAAGSRTSFTVTRNNNLGGAYTTGSTIIYLYSSSAGANKKFYDAATNGNIITSVEIINGNSTASVWYYDEAPGTYTITASDNASAPDGASGIADGTASITVTAGATTQFILSDPGDMYAKTRLGYTVTRKDAFGNLVSTGSDTAYLYSSSTSSTKKFYDDATAGLVITSIDMTAGHSSANFWYYDEEPGTYTITASDNVSAPDGATGIADGTDSVVVNPVAVKFVILPVSEITVDAPATVTIQAQKPDNSVDTNYQNDVTLNTTGSATGGGLVNIVNGVGTKNISDTVAETVQLSLTDSETTGLDVTSTQDAVFAGGATAQFVLSDSVTLSAGSRAQYTVTRKDQYNNLTTTGATTVYLYSSSTGANKKFYDAATDGNIIFSISIPDGQSSVDFWYYDETPGTYTITASDNGSAPDGNINVNDSIDLLTVTAGPVASFTLSNPGEMTTSTRLGYTVTRKDQFNNLVTSESTDVYLYSSSASATASFFSASTGGSSITSISIANGNSLANFWYYDEEPGTYTITASDSTPTADGNTGVTDGTDEVLVNAAPIVATRFVILDPGSGTVDASVHVTIQAQDGNGNLDTSYQTDVQLNTTGSATGGGLINITNGVGTADISDVTAETVTLTLTDSQLSGLDVSSTQNIIFSVGATAQFSLDNPGDMAAGTTLGYIVTRKDQFGNPVTTGATTVYLYGLPGASTKKFYDASSGGSVITFVNITDGNSTAQFWYYDEEAGSASVVASDNASAPDGNTGIADISDSVTVSAGSVATFSINNPGDMSSGTRLGYTVTRKDQFNNLVTSGITNVFLYSSSTGANKKFYDAASGGLVITSVPIDNGNSSAQFWYYDEAAGTWTITVSDGTPTADGPTGIADDADSVTVSSIPIVATKIVILDPGTAQINTPMTITIKAEDANNNVDTTFAGTVTLIASGSATDEGVVTITNGVGTITINDATAETVLLSLSDTGSTGLDVSSTASAIFSALPPVFNPSAVIGQALPIVGKIIFSGLAFPGANLSIVAISGTQTTLKQSDVPPGNGRFETTFTGLAPGARSFALLAKDKEGNIAQSRVYDLNLVSEGSMLEVDNIIVSPTISFPRPTVTRGDFLTIVGHSTPRSVLTIEVDGKEIDAKIVAGSDGTYKHLFNTAPLDYGSHTIKASQTLSDGRRSEFSPQKVFFTTNLSVPKTDFNNDGKIDISDWSIFLARWLSQDSSTRALDDLNNDSKVDTTDFSIFIRTLRR